MRNSRQFHSPLTTTHNVVQQVIETIFPSRCAGCGVWERTLFCQKCYENLSYVEEPFCSICGEPFDPHANVSPKAVCRNCLKNRYGDAPAFTALRSTHAFDGPLRRAIHRFKYQGQTSLAPKLSRLLWEYLIDEGANNNAIPLKEISLIVPVPLHSWRRWRRGYNQSTLLAQELSRLSNLPTREVLRRTRHTTSQVHLPRVNRESNIKGAFGIVAQHAEYSLPSASGVLLLDDVTTTGATLRECAKVLTKAGASKVYALTLARSFRL